MRTKKIKLIFAIILGFVLSWGVPSLIPKGLSEPQQQTAYSHQDILAELAQADIIYLAETHDSPQDGRAKLEIIQGLQQRNGKRAVALEMFQRPFQPYLDSYIAGELTETELIEKTEYQERWGFDWELYAPVFRFARTHQLPLLALNTPTEISRKVAREGLESLTEEERRYIPPLSEIHTDNQDYRQILQNIYNQHAREGHGNSDGFERFFSVQVLWDETMAQTIAQFWQTSPDYQIIVIAGKGHIQYGYGIPSRVKRRLQDTPLIQRSVWLGDFPEGEKQPADFAWR
ncbi:ChaN family lipoprotein [Lusitaniella coriacea]|uniref:ChaN family lipoprotein n=1 Tax=Lusitaniella coriacea TaxID=1983105 RepID=UPI003CF8150E